MVARKTPAGLVMPPLLCAAVLWLAAACSEDAVNDTPAAGAASTSPAESTFTPTPAKQDCQARETEVKRAQEVLLEYASLFSRHPYFSGAEMGHLLDETPAWTEAIGIRVYVTKKVDQSMLPPEDRIPGYLEGVSVQVIELLGLSPERIRPYLPETRAREVLNRHEDLFWRQPNVFRVNVSNFMDGYGEWTLPVAITVWVTEKVDQNTLPPEDRIPSCLEGVLVQIIEDEPYEDPVNGTPTAGATPTSLAESTFTPTPAKPDCAGRQVAVKRAREVLLKYDSLFWRQPNFSSAMIGFLQDETEALTETIGVHVYVTMKVDQSILPPEDKIPAHLEGVPVQVTEEAPPTAGPGPPDRPLDRAKAVLARYEDLFWRQPNVFRVNVAFLLDEYGELTFLSAITVWVTKKVDQRTLPPEDRIPSCLEGVLVQILEGEPL